MKQAIEKQPLLQIKHLTRTFDVSAPWLNRLLERQPRQRLTAVDDVSFSIEPGQTVSLVGESGCGKSTVARLVVGLYAPTQGEIHFVRDDLRIQMIFQDPFASLNPRWRVKSIIAEPIITLGLLKDAAKIEERVTELLQIVSLSASDGEKYPHEFSGGQRQRISIARALAGEPEFLVCDEPTSALDVSVQAQILNLMKQLLADLGLTYLFISHDLSVVRHMSDTIAVMYLGRIVEIAPTERLYANPVHPYTRLLLETIPDIDEPKRSRKPMVGEVPSPIDPPIGCTFHPLCALATDRCRSERPLPTRRVDGGFVVCFASPEQGNNSDSHCWWAKSHKDRNNSRNNSWK